MGTLPFVDRQRLFGLGVCASGGGQRLTASFHEKASEPKELVEISGATHVSLYDIPEDVDRAFEAMDRFFKEHSA